MSKVVSQKLTESYIESRVAARLLDSWYEYAYDLLPQYPDVTDGAWQEAGYDEKVEFPAIPMLEEMIDKNKFLRKLRHRSGPKKDRDCGNEEGGDDDGKEREEEKEDDDSSDGELIEDGGDNAEEKDDDDRTHYTVRVLRPNFTATVLDSDEHDTEVEENWVEIDEEELNRLVDLYFIEGLKYRKLRVKTSMRNGIYDFINWIPYKAYNDESASSSSSDYEPSDNEEEEYEKDDDEEDNAKDREDPDEEGEEEGESAKSKRARLAH